MNVPDISVVIPAYNSARFLPDAIASIRRQRIGFREIIIVDDGSTDNTEILVQQFHGSDIVYIKQDNAGPSAARNRGIEAAQSDWIAFLDADDEWTEDKTRIQLAILEQHPELALIAADMAETDEQGLVTIPSMLELHGQLAEFEALDGAPLNQACASLIRKNFIPTGTVLVRKQALLDAGMFPESIRFGEDLALWARLAARHPITCAPNALMHRRRHNDNATDATEHMLRSLIEVMRLLRDDCGDQMQAQGLSPKHEIAQRAFDLGYWLMTQRRSREARKAYAYAWRESRELRHLLHATLTWMPEAWVQGLRKLKQY